MEQEINKSEAFLKSVLQNSTGFSVPKDYFDTAEDRFSSFLIEKELPEETGFFVPENYFQTVEKSILKKTGFKKEVKVISLKSKFLKYIPVAAVASIALFLSINYFTSSNYSEINFDLLERTDIENWIVENSNELSDKDFITLLHNEISNENDFALTDLQNDAIEEYMINIEESTLLNENY
jgi:hypothetical protein|tara:strand:- start:162 stop:704 length:543 start_codon:yes stop_codon:yes gene_type:complete